MPNKYIKGHIHNGTTFVVDKAQVHNAKDGEFVEGTAFIPFEKGKWVLNPEKSTCEIWKCSLCGEIICTQGNFCPRCGAYMMIADEEGEDEVHG